VSSIAQRSNLMLLLPISAVLLTGVLSVFLNGQTGSELKSQPALQSEPDKKHDLYILLNALKTSYNLGEDIGVEGTIVDSNGTVATANKNVFVEAFNDKQAVYKSYAVSTGGKFVSSFKLQSPGNILVTAKLLANSSVPDALTTVELKSPIDTIAIAVIIMLIIGPTAGFVLIPYEKRNWAILLGIVSLSAGLVFLHTVASLGEALTTALSTILFVPIGTYIFDYINKRGQADSARETSVGDHRNEKLKNEVTSLIEIYEEICQHQATFERENYDDLTTKLSTKNYENESIVGTMANLPGLRINMYYKYINLYNECLEYKSGKKGYILNHQLFNEYFKAFKNAYAELEEVLYVNIIYSIAEINHKFLSFPTIRLPMRVSRPLYWELLVSNSLSELLGLKVVKFIEKHETNQGDWTVTPKRTKTTEIALVRDKYGHCAFYSKKDASKINENFTTNNIYPPISNDDCVLSLFLSRPMVKDIYELHNEIKKEDIYDDGIAYRFVSHLETDFAEKYSNLEHYAKNLRLTNLKAYNQQIWRTEDTKEMTIPLRGSTSDSSGIFYDIIKNPSHGKITKQDGALITYEPKEGYTGNDSFEFVVTDAVIYSEPAEIIISVL
jgi:Bacterial Ig domain